MFAAQSDWLAHGQWNSSETLAHKHQAVLSMVRTCSHDGRGGSMAGVELPLHPKEHSFHNILRLTIIQLAFQSLLALSTISALLLLVPGLGWFAGC